ncbi:MAG: transposase, partial [bacterium]|nr:transposase [bacterium]
MKELTGLPQSIDLTRDLCSYSSGILVMDGKYVKVKGYPQKIPFIYGIDYETHDILFGILVPSEDTNAFLTFFGLLKTLNYPIKIVLADDRQTLPRALEQLYPGIPLQLCQNHYLENIRKALHIRTESTHHHFFNSLKLHVFEEYEDVRTLDDALHHVLTNRCEG